VFGTGLSFRRIWPGRLLLGVLVMPVLLLMRDPVAVAGAPGAWSRPPLPAMSG
jgi:hypothetical protein